MYFHQLHKKHEILSIFFLIHLFYYYNQSQDYLFYFYIPFLIGPLYFGYYQLLLLGIILENIEIGLFLLISMKLSFSTAILIILFIHILYSIYANQICIFLWKKKLKKNPQLKLQTSIINPVFIILSVIIIAISIFLLYQANIIPHGLI